MNTNKNTIFSAYPGNFFDVSASSGSSYENTFG